MSSKADRYKNKLIQQRKFKTVPHQFNKKVCHWLYCSGCGLVLLKNEASAKRSRESCHSMED